MLNRIRYRLGSAVQHFQRACLGDRLLNFRPEGQHRGQRHAQLVDPDGQESLQQAQVRPQFPADTDPAPRRVGHIARLRLCAVFCNRLLTMAYTILQLEPYIVTV